MKNSIKAIAATALIIILSSGNSSAQEMSAVSAPGKTAHVSTTTARAENNNYLSTAAVNPMILAKFSALFPGATSQQWGSSDNNFWVSFLNNNRKASASFTVKGKIKYIITDCAMEQLPGSFRKTISKEYASFKLYSAIEIKAYDAVAYQAVLENASTYVTLKFTNEGVEEIQQLKKTAN